MKLHRLRSRLLLAMGLPVACTPNEPAQVLPPGPPPSAAPVLVDPLEPAPITEPPLDASPSEPDAASAEGRGDASSSGDDASAPPAPDSAWTASYALPPGTEKWCKHGTVRCQPSADTIAAPNTPQGKLGCAAAIEVACPCTPAGCNQLGPCIAPLQQHVTLRERTKAKTACCYDLPRQCVPPYVGRPLRVEGMPWCEPPAAHAKDDERARSWAMIAALEHASVASFARVALELLALGAPADLLQDTFEAALDEIRHAELARAIASRAAGRPIALGALPAAALRVEAVEIESFAAATFRDGCVEETLGALVASDLADAEAERDVRGVLEQIAADEARHAELAWRTLAWTVATGGAPVLRRIQRELEIALAETGSDTPRRELLRELVSPCVAALAALVHERRAQAG